MKTLTLATTLVTALSIAAIAACNLNVNSTDGQGGNGNGSSSGKDGGSDEGGNLGTPGDGFQNSEAGADSGDAGSSDPNTCTNPITTNSMLVGNLTLTTTTTGSNQSICASKQTTAIMCAILPNETATTPECSGIIQCQSAQSDFDGNGTFTNVGTALTGTLTMTIYNQGTNEGTCTYSVTGTITGPAQ